MEARCRGWQFTREKLKRQQVKFEWDSKKAKYNLKKHGVSFEEASSVFGDTFAAVYEDPDHSVFGSILDDRHFDSRSIASYCLR